MHGIPEIPYPRGIAKFLASHKGETWASDLAKEYPHTSYYRDRSDSFSLKELNEIGHAIIEAKRKGMEYDEALEEQLPPREACWTWRHHLKPDLIEYLQQHCSPQLIERNIDQVRDLWEKEAWLQDDSGVTDLFESHDYVELIWKIGRQEYLDNNLIYSHRAWPEGKELIINQNLQFALSVAGHTISDFRKHTGNRHEASEPLTQRRPKAPERATLDNIVEAIDNACSTSFMCAFYAIVPIQQLIELDLTKHITFDKCWFATTDPLNGTFHEVATTGPITLQDGPDGELCAAGRMRYHPADICCLHTPYYHSKIHN